VSNNDKPKKTSEVFKFLFGFRGSSFLVKQGL
jgi:hypothetical protein